jgi:hypothetical protein
MLRQREMKRRTVFVLVRSRGRGCAPVAANSDAPDSSRAMSMLTRASQPQKRERFAREC